MATSSQPTPLNPRQVFFVEHYLIDLNGKEAAIRAGYSRKRAAVRGYALLRRPEVRAAIAAAMARRAAHTTITPERVLEEYARIAFSDWRRFADWGPDHVRFLGTRALTQDDRAAIAEIVEASGGVRRVKLFDKQAALTSSRTHPRLRRHGAICGCVAVAGIAGIAGKGRAAAANAANERASAAFRRGVSS